MCLLDAGSCSKERRLGDLIRDTPFVQLFVMTSGNQINPGSCSSHHSFRSSDDSSVSKELASQFPEKRSTPRMLSSFDLFFDNHHLHLTARRLHRAYIHIRINLFRCRPSYCTRCFFSSAHNSLSPFIRYM